MLRIEQLLGREPARRGAGKVDLVLRVGVGRFARQLVGPRVHDGADHVAQVELVSGKIPGERFEQGRVARRVSDAKIINRIDNAAAQEVKPDPVHLRFGEQRLSRHPCGEGFEFVRSVSVPSRSG